MTRCGHLYCWPCLHMWLDTRRENPLCPVCKSVISKEEVSSFWHSHDYIAEKWLYCFRLHQFTERIATTLIRAPSIKFLRDHKDNELRIRQMDKARLLMHSVFRGHINKMACMQMFTSVSALDSFLSLWWLLSWMETARIWSNRNKMVEVIMIWTNFWGCFCWGK